MIRQIEPWIGEEELKEIIKVVKSKWITEGKKTEEFEARFKELTKAKHTITVMNGTVGMFIALKVFGIGQGDEVIVPNLTFIATPNSVKMANANPILVDIDKKTFNIDPKEIEKAITDKTKAIMPVHLYGQCADMDAILKIAKKHNLKIIEDAAQAVGSYFNNKHAGTFGEIGIFSLYGNKTITSGEGGVITTNDDRLARECYIMKNHGRDVKGIFKHKYMGYNFSYSDLHAAIAIAQLSKLDKILGGKKKVMEIYTKKLKGLPVEMVYIDPRCKQTNWFTNILTDNVEELSNFLKKNGIETRRFFYPIHMQPCYNIKGDFPNTVYVYEHGLSLPSSADLEDEKIMFVCKKIREFYE